MPTPGEHNPRRDADRVERVAAALAESGLDAIVCSLASNVLLLTGYWPVVGTSIALATRQRTLLLAPKDELNLAQEGWANEVHWFEAGSLQRLVTAADAVAAPLAELAKRE